MSVSILLGSDASGAETSGLDVVGLEVTTESVLRELEINFNAEVRPEEVVEISLYRLANTNTYYVEGKVEGKNSFIVRLSF